LDLVIEIPGTVSEHRAVLFEHQVCQCYPASDLGIRATIWRLCSFSRAGPAQSRCTRPTRTTTTYIHKNPQTKRELPKPHHVLSTTPPHHHTYSGIKY
jgi:hypothetical protein